MELSITQQFFDSIKKAKSIIIALPQHFSVDAVTSGLGLSMFLRQLGKQAVLAGSGQVPSVRWDFLPEPPVIIPELSSGKQLVVTVDTRDRTLDELSYQIDADKLEIFLKAKQGSFVPEDVTVANRNGQYDLIITLGAASLDDLGALYQNHAELFFGLPKINIDIKPDNEYFGTINLVDVTVSSLAEFLAVTLGANELGQEIGGDVATCFLAGIIAKTHSFQQPQTTPQTLTVAADLIQRGARQQDIIVSLYKTKDFSLLKLWGRALARLQTDEAHSLLYTILSSDDFARAQSGPEQLTAVLREFIDNVSGYQVLAVMGEIGDGQSGGTAAGAAGSGGGAAGAGVDVGAPDKGVRILIAAPPHISLSRLAQELSGGQQPQPAQSLRGAHQFVSVDLPGTTLAEAGAALLKAMVQSAT